MSEMDPAFSEDLLLGAKALAFFLFGCADAKHQRKVFHLCATSKMPHFKLGSKLAARKSVLYQWIKAQEGRSVGEQRKRA